MSRKQLIVTAKEITDHLSELNLTLDPQLRNQRKKWFHDNGIPICTINQHTAIEPTRVSVSELTAKLRALNTTVGALRAYRDNHKDVVLEHKDGIYTTPNREHDAVCATINAAVERIKTHMHWFRAHGQIIKNTCGTYLYIGEKEEEEGDTHSHA